MTRLIPIFAAAVVLVLTGCSNRDGTRIAFQSDRDGDHEIFVMDADGTNVQQLTDNDPFYDEKAVWSPDGTRIAFESDRDGGWYIFLMDADGTNVVTTNQKGMNLVWR